MKENRKHEFRLSCIKRLEFVSSFLKFYRDKNIVNKLKEIIYESTAKNILLYIPLKKEVNVLPLINDLRKRKINVFVPFMKGDSFKLVPYRLPLEKKRFGIKEPKNSFLKSKKIDLAIVPIIGIDKQYKRIGFGKGMYDRFFFRLDYKPTIIFTQLSLCKSKLTLSNNYDIQADYIIT